MESYKESSTSQMKTEVQGQCQKYSQSLTLGRGLFPMQVYALNS